jgi:1,4-alpha-glucan branching enzyme
MNARLPALALILAASVVAHAGEEIPTTFTYTDPAAQSVSVAGEFNNWEGAPMSRDEGGTWSKTIPLKPGHYGYKLIVNGSDWVFDPKNPLRKRVGDADNSAIVVGTKTEVTFTYHNSTAKTVHLAGEFNQWLDNAEGRVTGKTEWLMQGDDAGNWKYTVSLPPGRHKFKYVLDGERWEKDPNASASEDDNSIIEVTHGAVPAPQTVAVTFRYSDAEATEVFLAGEFNQWNKSSHPMKKDDSGVWTASLPLRPGKYAYKFVVGDKWKTDPECSETVPDSLGGSNSVKVVTH